MSKSKHIDKICIAVISIVLVITLVLMFGEKLGLSFLQKNGSISTSGMFTSNDLKADWDTSGATKIVLKGNTADVSGNSKLAYFSDNTLNIAHAGKYVISGSLNGSINIDADKEAKIWILFDGVDVSSADNAPLIIKQADKVFLTLKENSNNTLTYENSNEDSDIDGAVFSRDDLTINGKGKLTVTSTALHGIVCNDSLVFTGGDIDINAGTDGVHAHDEIKMCNTNLTVSAGDDGLHAGNDDETSVFYIESGNVDISKCYEGIEANDVTIAGGTINILPSDDGINAAGSGAGSAINIMGGDISIINKVGKDADGLDSNGDINISGGNLFISMSGNGTNNALDFGSENGGKCRFSGGTVVACGSSQMLEVPDTNSKQGFIMQTVSGPENSTLSLYDSKGKTLISKTIPCSFTSALISCPKLSLGDTVKLKVGDSETEIIVDNALQASVTDPGNGGNKMNGGDMAGGAPPEKPEGGEDMAGRTPPEKPEGGGDMAGGTPPEKPDGGDQAVPQDKNKNAEKAQNGKESPKTANNQVWILIAISAVVLLAGLFIVIKKK